MADVNKACSLIDMVGSQDKFNRYQSAVKNTLPKGTEFGRYWAMYVQIMQACYANTKVMKKETILPCLFNAAKYNLNPDPAFRQIFFIPYSGELTYQMGYMGMIQLAYNSGKVISIHTGLVYENDEQDFFMDEKGQHFLWRPNLKLAVTKKDRGRELFGFSCFTKKEGSSYHIMESYHIDDIKKLVLARMGTSSTPWKNELFEPEMRKKTVLRRHCKTEPMSYEILKATDYEEGLERGEIKKENIPELAGIVEGMVKDFEEPEKELLTPEQLAFAEKLK